MLPFDIVEPLNEYVETIVFYAKPKKGKSTVLSKLSQEQKFLILDTENSYSKLKGYIARIDQTKSSYAKFEDLIKLLDEVQKAGTTITKDENGNTVSTYKCPYNGVIIDTLTEVDSWSEVKGTVNYMSKPQGKKYNRKTDDKGVVLKQNGKDLMYRPTDAEWESAHELGQGFGYRYSREVMVQLIERVHSLFPKVIWVCHVKDKFVGESTDLAIKEISLTGKVKDILSGKVDTIMYGFRDKNKLNVTFEETSDYGGSRCSYLSGKTLLLSESNESDEVTTNWKDIFVDLYK